MKNTFGNTVTVTINTPPVYEAPRTGSAAVGAVGVGTIFAGLAGFISRRRKF
jgi:LPXTG-motif cell wall-anchored protein